MRSKSRGFVKLKSNNPFEAPLIKFNYMSHEDDFPNFRKSLRLSREILNQDALAPFKGSEIQPGDNVVSDEGLDEFIKNNCESAYHPCGTCKMGVDDMAVVDENLRVKGIKNLRVIDASVIPEIPSANLNAPVLMIAEKGSELVLS